MCCKSCTVTALKIVRIVLIVIKTMIMKAYIPQVTLYINCKSGYNVTSIFFAIV